MNIIEISMTVAGKWYRKTFLPINQFSHLKYIDRKSPNWIENTDRQHHINQCNSWRALLGLSVEYLKMRSEDVIVLRYDHLNEKHAIFHFYFVTVTEPMITIFMRFFFCCASFVENSIVQRLVWISKSSRHINSTSILKWLQSQAILRDTSNGDVIGCIHIDTYMRFMCIV